MTTLTTRHRPHDPAMNCARFSAYVPLLDDRGATVRDVTDAQEQEDGGEDMPAHASSCTIVIPSISDIGPPMRVDSHGTRASGGGAGYSPGALWRSITFIPKFS
jgi:hypothetical protein